MGKQGIRTNKDMVLLEKSMAILTIIVFTKKDQQKQNALLVNLLTYLKNIFSEKAKKEITSKTQGD